MRLDRDTHERLLHGRVLSPVERLARAVSALEAAAEAEVLGWGPPSRVVWQESVVDRLLLEVLGQEFPAVRTPHGEWTDV